MRIFPKRESEGIRSRRARPTRVVFGGTTLCYKARIFVKVSRLVGSSSLEDVNINCNIYIYI